jgi:cyclophilin family peptidyl-prolyl cis-trans isomerase
MIEVWTRRVNDMSHRILLLALLLFPALARAECNCFPEEVLPDNMFPSIRFETSMGDIVVELNRMRAPATANNFLRYVLEGEYNGTIFHRVIPEFVVQGGGYTPDFAERKLHDPVDADNVTAKLEEKIRRQLEVRGPMTQRELIQFTNARRAGLYFFENAIKNLIKADEVFFEKNTYHLKA